MSWPWRKREHDLERELRLHIEKETEEQQAAGLPSDDARYAARRAFGNTTFVKEEVRAMWGWTSVERCMQDVRYALRGMRRNPGVTAVAMISLALGIGANSAIFSLMDAVMFKTLPVRNPERLVLLGDGFSSGRTDDEPPGRWGLFSFPIYKQLQSRNQVFSDVLAFLSYSDRMFITIGSGESEIVTPKLVSGNYFSVLGVPALVGRTLEPEDDRPGARLVAVLSYSYWGRRFGRDPNVIGRSIVIRKAPAIGIVVQIAGVAPPGFFGEKVGAAPEFWLPLSAESEVDLRGSWLNDRNMSCLQMLGRLKPGIGGQQAQANMDVLFRQILSEYAGAQPSRERMQKIALTSVEMHPASRGISGLRTRYSDALNFLLALTGAVLLIACANIANLLLSRAVSRQKEVAVRAAIGASRTRLLRQMLTESIVLALAGGALGVLFAWWASHALVRFVSGTSAPLIVTSLNLRMLLFTGAVSLFTGVLFGLAPAWRAARAELQLMLKETGGREKFRLSRVLIAGQVAITLLLLVAAGAFVRSLQNLRAMDLGFHQDGVLVFELAPGQTGYRGPQLMSLYDRLLERVRSLPGVISASLSRVAFSRGIWGDVIRFPGDHNDHVIRGNFVTPGYLKTMGISLRAGRSFSSKDTPEGAKAAIVNETFARKFFPGRSALDERFRFGHEGSAEAIIIGVVKDFKYNHIRENTPPVALFSSVQFPGPLTHLSVRTSPDSAAIAAQVRQTIKEAASAMPVVGVTRLRDLVDSTLTVEELVAQLAAFFGLLAMLLACVGIYGTLSYAVAGRTNEIGIRLALGANPRHVGRDILAEMLWLVGAGTVIGIALITVGERLVNKMLFGLKGTDPVMLAVASLVLMAVAAAAAYLPARRASHVDPLIALRYE